MNDRLVVIVLTYNGLELTLDCLRSLDEQEGASFDVLVVDNASADGTVSALGRQRPDLRVLQAGSNLGYAGGNNVGLRHAMRDGADLFLLLNNDTRLGPDCLRHLLAALDRHPGTGVLGPLVYTWDEGRTICSAGGRIDWCHADAINIGAGEQDAGQFCPGSVDFINGCGLLITRPALQAVGLLDERYFMYWEETDLCVRVRRAGFDIRFEPAAHLRHKASIHSVEMGPVALYYMTRNRIRFFGMRSPGRWKVVALLHAFHGAHRGLREESRRGRAEHAHAMRRALRDALRGRWGALTEA
jgi:GT2 family glycosyltransferase